MGIYGVSISSKRIKNSFIILYPWYNDFSIVKYNNTGAKFLIWRKKINNKNYYRIFSLNTDKIVIRIKRKKRKNITTYRIVTEIIIGKKIKKGLEVHHVDHNHYNANPENLVVVSHEQHIFLHKLLKEAITEIYNTNKQDKMNFYRQLVNKMQQYQHQYY